MTPEEQRIAIAEACGLGSYREDSDVPWEYGDFDGFEKQKRCPDCSYCIHRGNYGSHDCDYLPDYLNDLNACAEMESTASYHVGDYCRMLKAVTSGGALENMTEYNLLHATAAQRCEAFLKTIGKWEEAP